MQFSFECYAATHIGNHRKKNEDNFLMGDVLLFPTEQASMSQAENKQISKKVITDNAANRIFAVSDGMGGHEFGEIASSMVVSALSDFAARHTATSGRKREKYAYIQTFQETVRKINEEILDYAADHDANENMGATLSGIIAFPDEVAPLNIGDSSTFLYEEEMLRKLTDDDNEESLFAGIDSARMKAKGKRLIKFFGLPKSSGTLTATIRAPIPLKAKQIFIIASDGLTDYLSVEDISDAIKGNVGNVEKNVNILVESALRKGGRDNITVVMVKVMTL